MSNNKITTTTKKQLCSEMGISSATLNRWLKSFCSQQNSPIKWEQIKTAKILTPKQTEILKTQF